MREIEHSTAFKRDFKRELKGPHRAKLPALLKAALGLLVADKPLPAAMQDHALAGDWKDFRDCHLRPDLVLIYAKPNSSTLQLARLGSHAELFG